MTSCPHLILTVDYELFGDGSGCLNACVLKPAERMMHIAERLNAPITFFAEVLEFMALSAHDHDSRAPDQLRNCLLRGHDVQLHLHPQWHNATRNPKGDWQLDMKRWRIGDLPADEIRRLLKQGRMWLESVISAGKSGYRCLAFRAGGWCIQPSEKVLSGLLAEGFAIDSTVAPGQWRTGRGEWSDFRTVPVAPFWRVIEDVCHSSSNGLWELPIAAGTIGRYRHLRALLAIRKQAENGLAPGCAGSYRGPASNQWQKIKTKVARLQQLGNVILDFSTLPAEALIEVTKQWQSRYAEKTEVPIPLVAIAHTKNFTPASEKALSAYLEWARQAGFVFSTYGHWLEAVSKR